MISDPDRSDRGDRQSHESGHQDHAPADHPDDTGQHVMGKVEVEGPRHPDHGQFEQHEPGAASEQEARQIGACVRP